MDEATGVIYREVMPKLKQNIDIGGITGRLGGGTRAVVDLVEGDRIKVFTEWGENKVLRVITLTDEQRAFIDLVRNSMITGFLHLSEKIDRVRALGNRSDAHERSAHELLSEVLGEEPASFIAVRPFEVTDILVKLRENDA